MHARFILKVATTASMVAVLLATEAVAGRDEGAGYAWTEPEDSGVVVGAEDAAAIRREHVPAGAKRCTVQPLDYERWGDRLVNYYFRAPASNYDWYILECITKDGTVRRKRIAVPRDRPARRADPVMLRDRAVDRLALPVPQVGLNPPGDQVVQLESWLWVDEAIWRRHSRSVTAGGVTATVTAEPRRTVWEMGNGDVVVCDGPGTPYDPAAASEAQSTDCSYTYRHSSAAQPGHAYPMTVRIEWNLSWVVTGAPGDGALPGLVTSSTVPVRVAEIQALNF